MMHARLIAFAAPFFLATTLLGARADASNARGVGLGVAAGFAVPDGEIDYKAAAAWGFYTDIPLISTFHITPSTIVYNLKPSNADAGISATDISLNFKFMIPLGFIEPFIGVTAGLTSSDSLDPHFGGLAGVALNLVANLDVFLQANYRIVLRDPGNVRDLMVYAGPLFRF